MFALWYVFAFVLGSVIGSFLNVVIWRLPRGESLVRPGSHCPTCQKAIRWHDNVPVVSWFVLRGRCRDCRSRISPRYPAVEAATGLLFVLAAWRFGFSWRCLVMWAFVAAVVAIACIDLDHMIIPDLIVLPGSILGLAASILLEPRRWWVFLVSAAGAAVFLLALVLLWPGGMGMGDVKMGLFMGSVLGPQVIVALFAAFLFGSAVGIALIASRKASRKTRIPFGPFLALGSLVGVFLGKLILDAYTGLYS